MFYQTKSKAMSKATYTIRGLEEINGESGEQIYIDSARTFQSAKKKAEKILQKPDCYSVWIEKIIDEVMYHQWNRYKDTRWYDGSTHEDDED